MDSGNDSNKPGCCVMHLKNKIQIWVLINACITCNLKQTNKRLDLKHVLYLMSYFHFSDASKSFWWNWWEDAMTESFVFLMCSAALPPCLRVALSPVLCALCISGGSPGLVETVMGSF